MSRRIPVKHMKSVLLKMFNVNFTPKDHDNKREQVLQGRQFSEMGKEIPTICDRSFEEVLPCHYLNKEGI